MRHMIYRLITPTEVEMVSAEMFIAEAEHRTLNSLTHPIDENVTLFWDEKVQEEATWQRDISRILLEVPKFYSLSPSAVLVLSIRFQGDDHWYAITYGHGLNLLSESKILGRWGLLIALNTITSDPTRAESLRKIGAKTLQANSLSSDRQLARADSLDFFGVNKYTELLKSVTGNPIGDDWGSLIYGSDGVSLVVDGDLAEVKAQINALEEMYGKKFYRNRFKWIDRITPITNSELVDTLNNRVIDLLKNKNVSNLAINPPGLVDWGNSDFYFENVGIDLHYETPELLTYLMILEGKPIAVRRGLGQNMLEALDIKRLKQHRLSNGVGESWPIYGCIEGEITHEGHSYILSEGDFYSVDIEFENEVTSYLEDHFSESEYTFPDNNAHIKEETYIENTSGILPQLLVMDQKMVRNFPEQYDKIEVCDLLSTDREFVHVKRWIRSSTFSHLVNQAMNSARYMLRFEDFRNLSISKVEEQQACAASDQFGSFDLNK